MSQQIVQRISPSKTIRMGLVTVLLLLVSLVATPAEATGSSPGPSHQQITHIVLLSGNVSASRVAESHGLSRISEYSSSLNGFGANIPEGRLTSLENDPRVRFVEPNLYFDIPDAPDTTVGTIPGDRLRPAGMQTIPTGVRRVGSHLSSVAAINGIDERVSAAVAVFDTGVDGSHPDLNVNVSASGRCIGVSQCQIGDAIDATGHGTFVAGIIGALDNDYGVVGVAPGTEIWSLQVCDVYIGCPLDAILRAHEYVSRNASSLVAVNMSMAGTGWSRAWREAIADNVSRGVVVVVAAGNSSNDIYGGDGKIGNGNEFIPAAYPEVLTVSAMTDQDGAAGGSWPSSTYGAEDSMAIFTNFGKSVDKSSPIISSGASIDVAAPGTFVNSTLPDNNYTYGAGTSYAAPHVTGAVALLAASYGRANSSVDVSSIRQLLIDSGSQMNSWRPDDVDTNSDADLNHEPLLDVSWITAGEPAPTPSPTPEPTPEPTPMPPADVLDVYVALDKANYAKRDTATVSVMARDTDGNPVSGTSIDLELQGTKGKMRTYSAITSPDGSVTFKIKLNYKSTGCGAHTLNAIATKDGFELDTARTTFTLCN